MTPDIRRAADIASGEIARSFAALQQQTAPVRPPNPNLTSTADTYRRDTERAQTVQAQIVRSQGFVNTNMAGEVAVDVRFGARFIEKPLISFGGELDENQSAEAGNFPTVSVVVTKWEIEELDQYRKYFIGATLAIVTTGKPAQRMIVHWGAEGKALLGPSGGAEVAL